MLCCIKPPAKTNPSRPTRPAADVVGPTRPAPTVPPPKTPRGSFEDLPNEIVCDIAGHVFRAAVRDPGHDVSSLACNRNLQAALSHELHAGNVLHNIQAARDFAELSRALVAVAEVFPPYRDGCLVAAIRLLPRLGVGRQAPAALWTQLRALLATRTPTRDGDTPQASDALLQTLVDTFRPASRGFGSYMGLENVLATIPADTALSPKLENRLIAWAADAVQCPGFEAMHKNELADRLLAAAPLALHPRLQRLFEFFRRVQSTSGLPLAESTALEMQALEKARAAGDPDHRLQLQVLSRSWFFCMRHSPECKTLFRDFFSRLDPDLQMELVKRYRSPLDPPEILAFLNARIGRAPGTTLLKALALKDTDDMNKKELATCARLVRDIVLASVGTPQLDDVLAQAICYESLHSLALGSFFDQCLATLPEHRRRALDLRLGLARVGCGEHDDKHVAARAPVAAQLDKVLNDSVNIDRRALETIVELRVGWLGVRQQARLIERIAQLPPADSARCLAFVISKLAGIRNARDAPPAQVMLDACRNLPLEYRAKPVAALLNLLARPDFQACTALLQGAVALHQTLPPSLRPLFKMQYQQHLEAGPGEWL